MGKILETFLNGQLLLDENAEKRTPEHQRLCDKGSELMETLKERLDDGKKKMLTELLDTLFEESCCDNQKRFVKGYCLGVLTTMEVFMEQDCFLECDE